jgi:tetratricopeptide (TPR) repeat protein
MEYKRFADKQFSSEEVLLIDSVEKNKHDQKALDAYNLVLSGRLAEGMTAIKKMLEVDPDNPVLLFGLGYGSEKCQDVKGALKYYSAAAMHHPKPGQIFSNMAGCLIRLKKYRKALDHSIRAVELEPSNMNFRFNLGLAYEKLKRWDLAYKHYEAYLSANKDSIKAYSSAIRCGSKLNDRNDASQTARIEELFVAALTLRPKHAIVRRQLVIYLIGRGDLRKAYSAALHRWPVLS